LRIIGDVDKLGDTSVNVSQDSKVMDNNSKKDLSTAIEYPKSKRKVILDSKGNVISDTAVKDNE